MPLQNSTNLSSSWQRSLGHRYWQSSLKAEIKTISSHYQFNTKRNSLLLPIVRVVLSIIDTIFEDDDSIVAPVEMKTEPGPLNSDVVHTAYIGMGGKYFSIIFWEESQPMQAKLKNYWRMNSESTLMHWQVHKVESSLTHNPLQTGVACLRWPETDEPDEVTRGEWAYLQTSQLEASRGNQQCPPVCYWGQPRHPTILR